MLNSKKGFTLVEIMFAVAIIGLIASMAVPALFKAMESAQQKARDAHIASIEKAKSMLTLPELVYENGRSLEAGTRFGDGEYTEENLLACMKNVESLADMDLGGYHIMPGDIGKRAYYSKANPASRRLPNN